jgi:hypothetical protein
MINTASDIYNSLLAFSSLGETTICHLHKPCDGHPLCKTTSNTPVVDFDNIEKKLATGNRSTMPSCDGVTLNNDHSVFCFVEIKGWEKFMLYNISDADTLSQGDRTKVDEQVATYDLKGKLMQSINDCEVVTGQKDLFPRIPYAYVIVTDINSEKEAIKDFAANLSSLAETASVWTYCEEKMKEILKEVDIAVKKVYAHCREFDAVISRISA